MPRKPSLLSLGILWGACLSPTLTAGPLDASENRYACVAASAALATEYFGKGGIPGSDFFSRLEVNDVGSAPLDKLSSLLSDVGLRCQAYRGIPSWYAEEYLVNYDCCLILITGKPNPLDRHSMAFFPRLAGGMIMCDLLTQPKVVDSGFLKERMSDGSILMVVSRKDLPSARTIHLMRYYPAYLIIVIAGTLVVAAYLKRRKRVGTTVSPA